MRIVSVLCRATRPLSCLLVWLGQQGVDRTHRLCHFVWDSVELLCVTISHRLKWLVATFVKDLVVRLFLVAHIYALRFVYLICYALLLMGF